VKLAFVVQRYGPDIAGGSEAECREYAERLSGRHDVTVLTTCATDYVTWANALPAGPSRINGVNVIRFPVTHARRLKVFADLSDVVFSEAVPPAREEEWFRENGPATPALLEHLQVHGRSYDAILFFAYRYFPAYFGLPLVADRAVLVPTAEEDPAISLSVLREFFAKPAGYIFQTPEEAALVQLSAGCALDTSVVAGMGIAPAADPRPGRESLDALHLPNDFVLCLGRIDRNKGAHSLAAYFLEHLERGGPETTLVFAGPGELPFPEHPRVRMLGFVPNAVRDALLAHARALIVPSPFESLSIALLEGWNQGVPALVNGACGVLKGQVRRANGGLYYESPLEFSEALTFLMTRPAEAEALGRQGREYVDREYRWPTVMERVEGLLNTVAGRPKPASTSVPR
jgi:glycosyltransferase involved in cell wall biosynthesis